MIKDSGERTVYENGFQRDMHEGKGRMDLLPWAGILELSKHCEEGAKKYGEHNVDSDSPVKEMPSICVAELGIISGCPCDISCEDCWELDYTFS